MNDNPSRRGGPLAPCAQLMMHRRRFLRSGGAALAAIPLASACDFASLRGDQAIPPGIDFDLADDSLAALREPGGIASLFTEDRDFAVILVRDEGDTFYAFDNRCPHNNLPMENQDGSANATWDAATNELKCNYHQSGFDETGAYLGGATTAWIGPERPIERYEVTFDAQSGEGRVLVRQDADADAGDAGTDAEAT